MGCRLGTYRVLGGGIETLRGRRAVGWQPKEF